MPTKPKQYKSPGSERRAKQYDEQRGNSGVRGYGWRWQKARKSYLKQHPLCIDCECRGITEPSNEVDHIVPHRGDAELFWDTDNWQALCGTCHKRKTARGL